MRRYPRSCARGPARSAPTVLPIEERYDLVVVGSGISGLSAAWYYRRANPAARILILEILDDFGGHAKRNEFTLGRAPLHRPWRQPVAVIASSLLYSPVAKQMLRDLGVDIKRFDTAVRQQASIRLRSGFPTACSFARESVRPRCAGQGREGPWRRFPLADGQQGAACARSTMPAIDPLDGQDHQEKIATLKRTSYRDYPEESCAAVRRRLANCSAGPPARFLRPGRRLDRGDRRARPGLSGLRRSQAAGPGRRMERALHLPFPRRQRLDRAALGALADPGHGFGRHHGRRGGGRVRLFKARRCRAQHPHPAQFHLRLAFTTPAVSFKSPMCAMAMTGIWPGGQATRCWHGFRHADPIHHAGAAGVAARRARAQRQDTDLLHQRRRPRLAGLEEPWRLVDLGADVVSPSGRARLPGQPRRLRNTRTNRPEPMVLHLAHVPGAPNQGLDARTQFRIGQGKLYAMTFADFETRIRDELDRMLGPGGFSSARDIAAITVNRWTHGYGYVANSLFDDVASYEGRRAQGGARHGPAASPSPIRIPAATPGCISRSIRRTRAVEELAELAPLSRHPEVALAEGRASKDVRPPWRHDTLQQAGRRPFEARRFRGSLLRVTEESTVPPTQRPGCCAGPFAFCL